MQIMTDLPLTPLKIMIAFFQVDSSMFYVQFTLVKALNFVGFLFSGFLFGKWWFFNGNILSF